MLLLLLSFAAPDAVRDSVAHAGEEVVVADGKVIEDASHGAGSDVPGRQRLALRRLRMAIGCLATSTPSTSSSACRVGKVGNSQRDKCCKIAESRKRIRNREEKF